MSDKPEPRPDPQPREMPEPIPDSFENVVAAVLNTPPKKDWRYQQTR